MFNVKNIFLSAGLSLLALPAFAEAVTATQDVNVRSGPGRTYPVVDTLRSGEAAETENCNRPSWCQVSHDGASGWVYSTFLAPARDTNTHSGPANVCVYKGRNHEGAKACIVVGEYNNLGGFEDRIRSFELFGGATIRFCTEPNMGGLCIDKATSARALGRGIDALASSLTVFAPQTAPVTPAREPATRASGEITIRAATPRRPTQRHSGYNLDTQEQSLDLAEVDVRYVTDTNRSYLQPRNGTLFSQFLPATATYDTCVNGATYDDRDIAFTDFSDDLLLCFKTSDGNHGVLLVTEATGRSDDGNGALTAAYLTWNDG